MNFFLHFIYRYETSQYKKAGDNLKKKRYKDTIKSITQHSYFEKKPNK